MKHENHSIYNRLKHSLAFMAIPSFILILVLALFTCKFFTIQKKQAESYTALGNVYRDSLNIYSEAKNRIFIKTDEPKIKILESHQLATKKLNHLKKKYPDIKIRLGFLQNMIDNYKDLALAELNTKNPEFEEYYKDLVYQHYLIQKTYSTYIDLLTNAIAKENTRLFLFRIIAFFISITLFAAIVIHYIWMTKKIMKDITGPISLMIENLNILKKGEGPLKLNKTDMAEYKELSKAIRHLGRTISENLAHIEAENKLKKQILKKENENLKILNTLNETKLIALQMQLNPHFLYNTLGMISQYSYIQGYKEIQYPLECLANLLRYGLDYAQKPSNIQKEITNIENYITIQKMRYGDRIKFILKKDSTLPSIELPALIIQPLVENAIMHGVRDMLKEAEIIVSVKLIHEDLFISVEDNGKGIPAEQLDMIEASFGTPLYRNKYEGLNNVHSRLLSFFKDRMKFQIESSPNCGTNITIKIIQAVIK